MKWPKLRDIESVGWIFWAVVFVLLAYPGYYAIRELTYDTASPAARWGAGLFTAAVGSGLISWAVNSALQFRRSRRANQRRKEEKRLKRRKPKRR